MALSDLIKKYPRPFMFGFGLILGTLFFVKGDYIRHKVASEYNVHFGATYLHNPQGNHYVVGFIPVTTISGEAKGNIYTIGFWGENRVSSYSKLEGDLHAWGLQLGANEIDKNAEVKGDLSAFGIKLGSNGLWDNSKVNGDLSSYGFTAENTYDDSAKIFGEKETSGFYGGNSLLD